VNVWSIPGLEQLADRIAFLGGDHEVREVTVATRSTARDGIAIAVGQASVLGRVPVLGRETLELRVG